MNGIQTAKLLEQQKAVLLAAKNRKGQRASNKPSREHILIRFNNSKLSSTNAHPCMIRTCLINHAYPPSTTALTALRPITISELRLETNHVGRVLIVRTITNPIRMQSIQNAVEDSNFEVDEVAVYNTGLKASPDVVLPKGSVFAIKEPYYKLAASGGYLIRVDHPSDILRLRPGHPLVPVELALKGLELDKKPVSYKDVGNAYFKNKEYHHAIEAYTQGLSACEEKDGSLRCDLHRNRAIANIYLQRYETAAADRTAAWTAEVFPMTVMKNNVKALYRTGRAFYCMDNFIGAQGVYESILCVSPDERDTLNDLAKAKARNVESTTGSYDFTAMSNSVTATHKRLDYASFTANVAIRSSGKKGRGLFATKAIKAGELVLVERAFSVAFASELGTETHIILNLNTNTARTGAHANLYYQLVEKARYNPQVSQPLLALFDGGYSPKCTAPSVDETTVIDTFHIAAIMEHNCFGCAETRTTDALGATKPSDRESKSVGVWITASYFNHACNANAQRSFMGDIMIEIFITYCAPEFDNDNTQEQLQEAWKFTCDCSICRAEVQTPGPRRKERKALIKEVSEFLREYRKATDYCSDKATITKAENLYTKLDATYDKKAFANVPRVALAYLSEWICSVCQTEQTIHKVMATSHRTLENLWYKVEVKGQSLRIDTTHCYSEIMGIDAVMYATHACFYYGKLGLGKQYEAFAKEWYRTMNGELRGSDERYGDSSGKK